MDDGDVHREPGGAVPVVGETYQLGAFWDFGGSVSVTGATFTLTINASGLLTATVELGRA